MIPAARMKSRRDHVVPLSRQATEVFVALRPFTGEGEFVFPGARSARRPISDNALNAALRSLGYERSVVTAHGFRATARTLLVEKLGCRSDWVEHQLAHAVRDPTGRAYNRTQFLDERRDMMQRWSDYLDTLAAGGTVA